MDVTDLDRDPLRQLAAWIDVARAAGEPMVEAMCVATSTPTGSPSARMVLLRGLDAGLVFYTDYTSAKAADLEANPRAAALFHYFVPVHRQVRVTGGVGRTSDEESDRYWATRPVASRRSALASRQSSVVPSRASLEEAVAAFAGTGEPARPPRWGGYRIMPTVVEFWEEGPARLHDRVRFVSDGAGGWETARLSP